MSSPTTIQALKDYLSRLQTLCQQANPSGLALQEPFLLAQQHFQSQILPLGEESSPALQPILTEMNRTLRLLAMDVAFLQAARQPLKAQQRQQQMGERLQQLLGFCEALSQAISNP
ncbi:MAG: heterocyst frequency control protein PatD [Leptolyngbyaceae cyanobacterium SM2_5_2]|nr:heterocyst frequency control protein PatD [Leptolyngbyaceae cyanobacterium SM2_5_2]